MANNNDWLGGYTLQELLGAAPVSKSPKQIKREKKAERKAAGKRGAVSTVAGAPFRAAAGLVKIPVRIVTKLINGVVGGVVEILKLPIRVVGAIVSPWKRNG